MEEAENQADLPNDQTDHMVERFLLELFVVELSRKPESRAT